MPVHETWKNEDAAGERQIAKWPMPVGVVAAWVVLEMLTPWLRRGSLPRLGLVIVAASLLFVAVMISGGVVRFIYRRLYGTRRVTTPVVRAACLTALWVPAWLLFIETWSLLMIVAGAICVACLGVFIKNCEIEPVPGTTAQASHQAGTPFLFEDGLLARMLLPSLLLVLLLDGVIVLSAMRSFVTASIAAGVFAGVLAWRAARRSTAGALPATILPGGRQAAIGAAAFLFTIIALLPYLRVSARGFRAPLTGDVTAKSSAATNDAASSKGYVGVILLPPSEMQKKIVAPVKRDFTPHFGVKIAEPMEIPFDGQYWYFKWPEKQPRPTARVVRGNSTKTQVSSSDRYPLMMEAHQKLSEPLDLGCCSALDLIVENADQLSGAISMELWVKKLPVPQPPGKQRPDHEELQPPPHYLGTMTIPSSELPIGQRPNASGKAVEEKLIFPIPAAMEGTLFDEITVVVRTAPERARMGAKVAVKKFVLEP